MAEKIMGLGKLERTAVGGLVGAALNSGVHFILHDGQMIENVFDPKKALAGLGAELGVSVLTGVLFKSAPAGFISGLSALALFAIDMAVPRNPNAAAPATPGAPATALPKATQAGAAKTSSASAQVFSAMASPLTSLFNSIFGPSTTKPAAAAPAMPSLPIRQPVTQENTGFVTSYDQIIPRETQGPDTYPQFVTESDIYGGSSDNGSSDYSGGEFVTGYEGMAGARRRNSRAAVLGAVQSSQPAHMKVGNGHIWRPGKIATDADVQQYNTYTKKYPRPQIPRRY